MNRARFSYVKMLGKKKLGKARKKKVTRLKMIQGITNKMTDTQESVSRIRQGRAETREN